MKLTRRETLNTIGAAAVVSGLHPLLQAVQAAGAETPHIATNTYPWLTFARRNEQAFSHIADELLADIARCGIAGYEPIITTVDEFDGLAERLGKHSLEMRSIYVNSVLHESQQADKSIKQVLAIGQAAQALGTKIIVTNPSPIRWGGPEDKTDVQLRTQAAALDELGAELRAMGFTLAYHNHDAELRQGGREFHHMLTATKPENVKFCLDSHWIYRGCGNSEVAVFDALAHYHERVVELHLRQSIDGSWTEAFAMQGDIDYARLIEFLIAKNITPHFVLEQAIEASSPHNLSVVQAHRQGRANLASGIRAR